MKTPHVPDVTDSPAAPLAVGCDAGFGTGIREPDGSVTCAKCGYECEWEECNACGGEGGHDGYEEDPNWYQPGEMTTCCQCGGSGGDRWCENRQCETQNITKIIKLAKVPNADLRQGAGNAASQPKKISK